MLKTEYVLSSWQIVMEQLKACIKRYQAVDNKLREQNSVVYSLREERHSVEVELTEIVKRPEFIAIDKLQIPDDSVINIVRPGSTKTWALSKKELSILVTAYFEQTMSPTPASCIDYILTEKKKVVSTEFAFNRVVKE